MINNKNKFGSQVFYAIFFSYSFLYIGRKNFSICIPQMVDFGIIDKIQAGTIGTCFLLSYAIGQFINGQVADKTNPKNMIYTGLIGASICNLAFSISNNVYLFMAIWCINGFFCSMLWAPFVKILALWVPKELQNKYSLVLQFSTPLGIFSTYFVSAILIKFFNWRMIFLFSSLIVLFCFFLSFYVFTKRKDYIIAIEKENLGGEKADTEEPTKKANKSTILMLLNLGMISAIVGIFINGVFKDGLDLWIPTLLIEGFDITLSQTSFLTTILPFLSLLGIVLTKQLHVKITKNEMVTNTILFIISGLLFIPIYFILGVYKGLFVAFIAVIILSLVMGASFGINAILLTYLPLRFVKKGKTASVTGILNAISYLAASLSGVILGIVSSNFGWSSTIIFFIVLNIIGTVFSIFGIKVINRYKEKYFI